MALIFCMCGFIFNEHVSYTDGSKSSFIYLSYKQHDAQRRNQIHVRCCNMQPASLENKCLSTGVLQPLSSCADLPSLTPRQHTLTEAVLRSEDNGGVRVTATTTRAQCVCVCVHPPRFSRPLRRKEALSRSISDLSCSSSTAQPG